MSLSDSVFSRSNTGRSGSKKARSLPPTSDFAGLSGASAKCRGVRGTGNCSRRESPRSRSLPSVATTGERRRGLGVARPRRGGRSRGRTQDRRARGKGGREGGARGRGRHAPSPSEVPARARARPRRGTRLRRVSLHLGLHLARCAARRRARRLESVEAAAQILEALAHAHSKGVIHRDVKPANVMVESGEEISIRLLDFGMAQIDEADTLTAAGDVPGTLAYIAPERLGGAEATGAADVWSLGVILWEALAGRHPFWAVSPLETARRVEQGAQPLAELRPDLPRKLCRTVDRMLSNDPRKRPPHGRLSISCARWRRIAPSAAAPFPPPPACRSRGRTRSSPRRSRPARRSSCPSSPAGGRSSSAQSQGCSRWSIPE